MRFNEEDIGSNLMYALTSGLYSRDVSAIREYFQNAYDPPANATKIEITFDNGGVNCSITDNGEGMDEGELRRALGVGIYTKEGTSEGIFGIGIWSGVAVCDKIVIITKKKGSPEKLRIEIMAKEIRETSINNNKLTDFLSERTTDIEHINAHSEVDSSFTVVRLENILTILRNKKDKTKAFTEEGVTEFVVRNLPIPIDKSFEHYHIIKNDFDDLFIRDVEVTINGKQIFRHPNIKKQVRKPVIKVFSTKIPDDSGKVSDVELVKIWASLNKEYITLNEQIRGIDFRHNGFKIEEWSDVKAMKGGTFHERWVGEIHTLKPDLLRPTAGRDAFQPVSWRDDIDEQIAEFLTDMQGINSFVSAGISGLKKEVQNLKSPDLTISKKNEIIKKAKEKNLTVKINALKNKPEFRELISELENERDEVKKDFEEIEKEVTTQTQAPLVSRPDIKNVVGYIPNNKKLSVELKTLMEEQHEVKTKIDPFNTLKRQIEEKTNKTYSSFSEALDSIGTDLTLYPRSKHKADNDAVLQKFLKETNMIFRNIFEHASDASTEWFTKSKNKGQIKSGYLALIGFVSLIIEELVPLKKDP